MCVHAHACAYTRMCLPVRVCFSKTPLQKITADLFPTPFHQAFGQREKKRGLKGGGDEKAWGDKGEDETADALLLRAVLARAEEHWVIFIPDASCELTTKAICSCVALSTPGQTVGFSGLQLCLPPTPASDLPSSSWPTKLLSQMVRVWFQNSDLNNN